MVENITVYSRASGCTHGKLGVSCQDFLGAKKIRCSDKREMLAIALADGHGAPAHDLSGPGAKLAVKAALDITSAIIRKNIYLNHADLVGVLKKHLPKQIVARWNELIAADAASRGTEFAAVRYGTTLLLAIHASPFTLFCRVGDGSIVVKNSIGYSVLWSEYETDRGNYTESLCMPDAARRFKFVLESDVEQFLLATDGLVNSLSDFNQMSNILKFIVDKAVLEGTEAAKKALNSVATQCANEGSGDDTTIAIAALNKQ